MQDQGQSDEFQSPPPPNTGAKQAETPSPDGGDLPTPSPEATNRKAKSSGGRSRSKATKSAKSANADHEFLQSMTQTVTNLGDAFVQTQKDRRNAPSVSHIEEDEHEMWAKILARKVRRMDETVGEQFKIEVDIMALKILQNQ